MGEATLGLKTEGRRKTWAWESSWCGSRQPCRKRLPYAHCLPSVVPYGSHAETAQHHGTLGRHVEGSNFSWIGQRVEKFEERSSRSQEYGASPLWPHQSLPGCAREDKVLVCGGDLPNRRENLGSRVKVAWLSWRNGSACSHSDGTRLFVSIATWHRCLGPSLNRCIAGLVPDANMDGSVLVSKNTLPTSCMCTWFAPFMCLGTPSHAPNDCFLRETVWDQRLAKGNGEKLRSCGSHSLVLGGGSSPLGHGTSQPFTFPIFASLLLVNGKTKSPCLLQSQGSVSKVSRDPPWCLRPHP